MKKVICRIIDANINRAIEGIRVVEDILRFFYNDKKSYSELRQIRHNISKMFNNIYPELLNSRESIKDPGKVVKEKKYSDTRQILVSNFHRIEESLRVLEEITKLIKPQNVLKIKKLRYTLYDIEKKCLTTNLYKYSQKNNAYISGIYCILPEFDTIKEYTSFTEKVCKSGVDIVQLRIKNKPTKFFYDVAVAIRQITKKYRKLFIINDRFDIAVLVNADGVHLGQDDIPANILKRITNYKLETTNFIIGISTHSLFQVKQALKLPVDYISIGPVFKTPTKPDYKPIGIETVKKVVRLVNGKKSVVVIGGINETNVNFLSGIGMDAIATVSALEKSKNSHLTIKKFKSIIKN